jgi:CHAT domain-containing protein/tetratricopeptide (TPR) repeat protein
VTTKPRALPRRLLRLLPGLLLGSALTLLIPWIGRALAKPPTQEPPTLASTLGPFRLTEGRIDGQTDYAPYRTPLPREQRLSLPKLQHALETPHTTREVRDHAFLNLLAGRLDPAIAELEDAIQKAPNEPTLLSDLSALYMERARQEDRAVDFVSALEMADRAFARAPQMPEVIFNRALALEHVHLSREAQTLWNTYMTVDGSPGSEKEAMGHLTSLSSVENMSRVWTFPTFNKYELYWLLASLRCAEALGWRCDRCFRMVVGLREAFPIGGEDRSVHFRSHQVLDRAAFLSDLAAAKREAERIDWLPSADVVAVETAQLENLTATDLEAAGQVDEAWHYRLRTLALKGLGGLEKGRLVKVEALTGAIRLSLARGQVEVALDFQNEIVRLTQRSPTLAAENSMALLHRARIEAVLGQLDSANLDLVKGLQEFHLVLDPASRNRLAACIDLTRREIQATESRATAIAEDLSPNPSPGDPEFLGASADLHLRRRDIAGAERDLQTAITDKERQRAQIHDAEQRSHFLDQALHLYERLESLELNSGKPEAALEVLERFRTRTLGDQLSRMSPEEANHRKGPQETPSWQELCARVPLHTDVVVYAVLDGRLVTWLVRGSGIDHLPDQDWEPIRAKVLQLRYRPEASNVLKELYSALVGPLESRVNPEDRIVFVPAGALYEVPFAALQNPKSNLFLIEGHAVGISPSISEFLSAVERDRGFSESPPRSALLVGAPLLPQNLHPELPALSGSREEIERLSQIYKNPGRVLTGEEATQTQVLAALPAAEVAHFSVHGAKDSKDPGNSRLVLSPLNGHSGDLAVRDILKLHLGKTRVVMLAACETQAGPVSPSEGSLSLASAFLAAGVPAVVGTLRAVDDQSAARISVRFHQELRAGADAFAALRAAQLEELHNQKDRFDWSWAGFQVLGGVAERPSLTSVQTGMASR